MFLINLLLALTWVALTGALTVGNFIAGLGLGYVVLWVVHPAISRATGAPGERYFTKVRQIITFFFYFLYKLVVAGLRVAVAVVSPLDRLRPGIVAVPLDIRTDIELTLLVNLITLTPGTLSLDVSDDRGVIYVHAMHVDDVEAFRLEIKEGFERRIKEVFA